MKKFAAHGPMLENSKFPHYVRLSDAASLVEAAFIEGYLSGQGTAHPPPPEALESRWNESQAKAEMESNE